MRAAVELAGYTPSESDELRKAISKKKKEDIEKHRNKFVKGAVEERHGQGDCRRHLQGLGRVCALWLQQISCRRLWCDRRCRPPISKSITPPSTWRRCSRLLPGRPKRSPSTLRMRAAWACLCLRRISTPQIGILRSRTPRRMASHISALGWARSRMSARLRWKLIIEERDSERQIHRPE